MNRIYKFLSVLLVCLMVCGMSITAFAAGQQTGTSTVTADVPVTVTLNIGSNGSVKVEGTSYTGNSEVKVALGTVVKYDILPASGYKTQKVTYNGTDVTNQLVDGVYIAPALTDNANLTVTFAKKDSGKDTEKEESSAPFKYSVIVKDSKHGYVTSNKKTCFPGLTVELTVKPDDGYELDTLTVQYGSKSKQVKVTEKNGKYRFTMPFADVTVNATFAAVKANPATGAF